MSAAMLAAGPGDPFIEPADLARHSTGRDEVDPTGREGLPWLEQINEFAMPPWRRTASPGKLTPGRGVTQRGDLKQFGVAAKPCGPPTEPAGYRCASIFI
ncbi:hypothetical protein ACIRSS_05325 [Amycolatopsis sp. NPDC101161]|uniref:hypothetical protein n=1 Tax=Amycolatopsis sp. NPDC101161 TaxID=3363940 RepID=UPI00382BDBDC